MELAFTREELEIFKSVATKTQSQLLKGAYSVLNNYYSETYACKDYIIAEGNIPVMLIAHLDTVFKIPPTENDIFYDFNKQVMWGGGAGLGADDRAGVYAIFYILSTTNLRPWVLFTTEEETGGQGAKIAALNERPDVNYIIELDRKGVNECVFYDCDNEEFEKYVHNFGFVTKLGTFSDISILCPAWKIAGVNLSVGYLHEHSYAEMLYLHGLKNTIDKVIRMLDDAVNTEKFAFIPANKAIAKCEICQRPTNTVFMSNVCGKHICIDCIENHVRSCSRCGTLHFDFDMTIRNAKEVAKNSRRPKNKIPAIYLCKECKEKGAKIET